ncbi:hypothetical protein O3G_MSEX000379 [Manduca sexta]|nr:hypothetical protein O3G_MSEX000379 [Manduca sexta]
MTSQKRLEDLEIYRLLQEQSDEESQESNSEFEDNLLEDEVQSDVEDCELSAPLLENQIDTENIPESLERTDSAVPNFIVMPQRQYLRGKNDHRWTATKGRTSGKVSSCNIIRTSRGPIRMNKNLYEPLECFSIFITDDIVEEITKWTNAEIQLKIQIPNVKATFKPTSSDEIRALLGILTLTAAMKDNHLTTNELFDCSYSGNRYVAAMSRDRFDFLIRCLRMDDKSLRQELRATDTFVPIRKIWEIFINHCRSNYIPGPYVTIDEQLLGFRGRCPFRMYIPNKPNKYGLKIVMICDSATRYMIDAMPYLGKSTQTNGLPLGEFYVKELTKTIHGSNRNVTCDNWFTSVPLAKNLLKQPYNLTLVGTIRSNKREIPEELKKAHSRAVGTSMFCYDGPLTLVSYKPKPNKIVYVLSSCDEEGTVHPTTGKPSMIHFYNETKGGVDTFDQMCSSMSCSRKTNRWPMAMFYGILNMAYINAYIIYCDNMLSKKEKPLGRRLFMKKLSNNLITPWMETRQQVPTLPTNIKEKIAGILPKRQAESLIHEEGEPEPKKRKYCAFCPSKIRRMTKSICDKCKNPICGEHKSSACPKCL